MTLIIDERDIALGALRRFATEDLSPAELAVEIERWEHHRALLAGDLAAADEMAKQCVATPCDGTWELRCAGCPRDEDAATLRNGIAYADHRLGEIERQAKRIVRAGVQQQENLTVDFEAARYADLVGLAETLTSQRARTSGRGRFLIACPFHEDRRPSLVIYPPGQGWWCPVCRKGGQDAASFAAEYFNCSQLEGLRWVMEMADGMRAG